MNESSTPGDDIPFSNFDPDGDAWFATLLFWRPSRLSDESMQLHFGNWDGRWSEQTKSAMLRFGAKGLDLNENWALSSPDWSCPACRRFKADIFRLSKRGVLLGKLELHHDHIRDHVWPRAQELFGADWLETRPKSSIPILDQIRDLTSRFDLSLVCSECNTADGKVKSRFRAETDPRFSFTTREIGAFVRSHAGNDHEIDYERAYALWEAEKANFQARLSLLDQLLGHLAHGRLARDQQGMADARIIGDAFDLSSLLMRSYDQETKNTERSGLLWRLRDEFLARSTQRDSARLESADGKRTSIVAPTDDEYAAYADPVSRKTWLALPSDWACPVCAREKRELIRMSKKREWSGGVRSHEEYIVERDTTVIADRRRLFPDFRNEIVLRDTLMVKICSDCLAISAVLTQRDPSLTSPYLSLSDRRDCIKRSQPHSPHEIDFDIAARHARSNESFRSPAEAFLSFLALVRDFTGRYNLGREQGKTEKALLAMLAEELSAFHGIDDVFESMRLTKWLLSQAPDEAR